MNPYLIYTLIILFSIVFGGFIGRLITKLKFEKENSALSERSKNLQSEKEEKERLISKFQEDINLLNKDKENLTIDLTRKISEIENLQKNNAERDQKLKEEQSQLRKDFELMANSILERNSQKITEQNKENLKTILNPLQDKIQTFEKRIDITHKESIDYHAALRQQIIGLKELNVQMGKDAVNLTKALKGDSKTQGNWGELVLERVLEKSGLEKGREYEMEKSFNVEGENQQRLRPDVIIHLPDNKKMIVDSKVSLTAYEQYVNADDEIEKDRFLKEHILSLNRHVSQLSEKKYEDLYQIESPDFVLLFVPIEPAFAIAINNDNQLYNKAFEKNIVIVTPSTLLATLRTIDTMWNNEKQQRNAIEIARQAGALYDKFEGLINDLTKVGKKMDEAKTEYKGAMNKLVEGRGNLITSVEKIKKLGAKAKKSLPEAIVKRAKDEE
ncbi:DNA recombination protein RmuC [Urechidicola croceus]|uniref:DNA polymerase V n=1 Tax=Urechidicola croceus TaxID=1850246 RepID=A0A1D8P5K1_9FLAO|nr:DNA recombination protein RmuC [Urechidicola croceus]AOW19858.1 DNA polymerase V [Urechidicola croceus]